MLLYSATQTALYLSDNGTVQLSLYGIYGIEVLYTKNINVKLQETHIY